MDKTAFDEDYIGRKLSVATRRIKPDGTPESYIAFLEKIGEDFIILDYAKASLNNAYGISKVILPLSEIIGVWVYE
jgi:hypothetical protein